MRLITVDDYFLEEQNNEFFGNSNPHMQFRAEQSLLQTPKRKRSTLDAFDFDSAERGFFEKSMLRSFCEMDDNLILSPAPMEVPTTQSGAQSPPYRSSISRSSLLPSLDSPSGSPPRKNTLRVNLLSEFTPLREKTLQTQPSDKLSPCSTIASSEVPSKSPIKRARGGCNCRHTSCMRLNCKCFKTLGYCGEGCACLDCLNREEFSQVRDFVVEKTKEINRVAFRPKAVPVADESKSLLNSRGCSCKTGCQKNYCECFRLGTGCSPICKCQDCVNEKIKLNKEEVVEYMKVARRTKHKIVIGDCVEELRKMNDRSSLTLSSEHSQLDDDKFHARGLSIAFQRYKRVKGNDRSSESNFDDKKKLQLL